MIDPLQGAIWGVDFVAGVSKCNFARLTISPIRIDFAKWPGLKAASVFDKLQLRQVLPNTFPINRQKTAEANMYKKAIKSVLLLAGVFSLSAAGDAFAHHSFGMFDMTKNVTVKGVVKDFQWTNPHVWIDIVIKGPGGKQGASFSVEAGSVAILQKDGWTRNSIKPGDEVTVVVHPLRTDAAGGSLVSATVNGKLIGRPE